MMKLEKLLARAALGFGLMYGPMGCGTEDDAAKWCDPFEGKYFFWRGEHPAHAANYENYTLLPKGCRGQFVHDAYRDKFFAIDQTRKVLCETDRKYRVDKKQIARVIVGIFTNEPFTLDGCESVGVESCAA